MTSSHFTTLRLNALILAMIWLLPALPLPAESEFLTFEVTRRAFANPRMDKATSDTVNGEPLVDYILKRGFTQVGADDETGLRYVARRSKVRFSFDENTDMNYQEDIVLTTVDGEEARVPYRSLELPYSTEPRRTVHPLMALHPFALVAPEFEQLRRFDQPIYEVLDQDDDFLAATTTRWNIVMESDPETGNPARLMQYCRTTGNLLRRTEYERWDYAPSGRLVPRRVVTRTYLDGLYPLVELVFENIEETMIPPDAKD